MGKRAVSAFGKAGGAGAGAVEESEEVPTEQKSTGVAGPTPAEQKVIEGGPGAESAQQPWKPFSYGGKTFDSEAALTAHLDGLGAEVERLKKTPPPVASPAPPAAPPAAAPAEGTGRKVPTNDELVTALLSDPTRVIADIKEDIRKEYRQERTSERVMEQWWDSFWDANKELKPYKQIVDMTMASSMGELAPLTMDKAAERLAEKARSTIISINKDAFATPGAKPQAGRAVVEGAGTPRPAGGRAEPEAAAPKSLSSIIKERARARSAGAQPTKH